MRLSSNMATSREKIGYLDVKIPSKLKGFGWTSWRRRWVLLHHLTDLATNKSIIRMTFYSSQEIHALSKEQKEKGQRDKGHTLYIEDIESIRRVQSKTKLFAFTVMGGNPRESCLHLAGTSETEAQEWIEIFSSITSSSDGRRELDIGEVYHETRIIDSDSSLRIGLAGRYLMVVSLNALSIYSCQDGSLCHEWRLNHLLSFHVDDKTTPDDKNKILTITAGRSSPSGAGVFSFFFHNADAQEVISIIASSIQRISLRRGSSTNKHDFNSLNIYTNQTQQNRLGSTRMKRAGSCGLPAQSYADFEHRRQSSLPYELERAIFINSSSFFPASSEGNKPSRRSTIISRTSVKSEENGKSRHFFKTDKKNCNKEMKSMSENATTTTAMHSESDSNKQTNPTIKVTIEKTMEQGTGRSTDDNKAVSNVSNQDGVPEGDAVMVIPNYFRRPSWFSDTTSADAETSSSDERHNKTIKQCTVKKGFIRKRSHGSTTSQSTSAVVTLASDLVTSPAESSDNEADDEVENDEENDDNVQQSMSRKTSAGSHLYQELPETYHNEEQIHCTHCKLCYKPPLTPPELPPRSELMSPRQRYNSDSVCTKHGKQLPEQDINRSRSVSDSQQMINKSSEGTDTRTKQRRSAVIEPPDKNSIKPEKLKLSDKAQKVREPMVNIEKRPSKSRNTRDLSSLLRKKKDQQKDFPMRAMEYVESDNERRVQTPSTTSSLTTNVDDDPLRKISVLSGFYHDIEDVPSDTTDGPDTKENPPPPELPPRCKGHHKKGKDDAHYEDLDRYRKNIQKYFGIPLSELNQPPPLPSRPKSLPTPPNQRNRTRCRLRSVGRKKKAKEPADFKEASVGIPTDDSMSVNKQNGVHRVQAWPLSHVNLDPKRHSFTTENSIYSIQDEMPVGNDYFTLGRTGSRYACFQCATCGAANQVFSSPPQTFRPGSFPPTNSHHSPHDNVDTTPIPFQHLLSPGPPPWFNNQPIYRESAQTESTHHWSDSITSDMQSTYGDSDFASRQMYVNNNQGEFQPNVDDLPEADNDIYTDMSGANCTTWYLSMDSLSLGEPKKPEPPVPVVNYQPKEPIYINWPPRTYKDLH